ncbi:MAG: ROK family protein [Chloroflexota bacterium]
MEKLYGCIEGGGTKFVCAVGTGPESISDEIRFPTTTPEETLGRSIVFFKKHTVSAIGLASFGPLDLNPASPTFGFITTTPKPGWAKTDLLGPFKKNFNVPITIDTDVNAAAFGEYFWLPENQGLDSLVYFTIGTGIGGGIVANGKVIRGLTHTEAGHVRLPHDFQKDPFPGACPFHGDCFEGLANGPAIAKRWGQSADSLPDDHPAWELEAGYIAAALANIICTVSPQRIVLGGGVMERHFLFPLIRNRVREFLNGYVASPIIEGPMDEYIVSPGLGKRSGILGAMALAKTAELELNVS